MSALSRRHFEQGGQGESASTRATLMAAAAEVGLDVAAAKSFLETDELVKEVWHSYGATIHQKGIHSIPLFVFNVPQLGLVGGPFRQGAGTPFVVNGSMDAPTFLRIFEGVYELFCQARTQGLAIRLVHAGQSRLFVRACISGGAAAWAPLRPGVTPRPCSKN
mmetsp:Transcript_2730/g.4865  ORF Transcript_2730/g.4865 Transcript_2730/m.4865 type:complete len:163 (-) Transcript_2730:803-1291(-)